MHISAFKSEIVCVCVCGIIPLVLYRWYDITGIRRKHGLARQYHKAASHLATA